MEHPVSALLRIKEYCTSRVIRLQVKASSVTDPSPSFTCKIKFESIEALGKGDTEKEAQENAASEALKLMKISEFPHHKKFVSINDPDEEVLVKAIGNLKEFCMSQNLSGPKFSTSKVGKKNEKIVVKCVVEDIIQFGSDSTEERATQRSAFLMFENLKEKFSSPPSEELPPEDVEVDRVIRQYQEYMMGKSAEESKSNEEKDLLKLNELHLVGQFDPFFVDNKPMQDLKTTSIVSIMSDPKPFAMIEEILKVHNIKHKFKKMPTHDNICAMSLTIFSHPVWSVIGSGDTYAEARLDACREMLMHLKIMVS